MKTPTSLWGGVLVFGAGLIATILLRPSNGTLIAAVLIGIVGALANLTAVAANSWKMPIVLTTAEARVFSDEHYCIVDNSTRLRLLSDRFRLFKCYAYSLGDVLMVLGAFCAFVAAF